MGRELTHGEVRDLLGAYALHAVEEDERELIDLHLQACVPCRNEVAEHREVSGLLASGWLPPPEGVWDRIADSLEEAPPPMRMPPVVSLDDERRRRRPLSGAGRALAGVGIAASVAVMGLLGAKVIDTSDQVSDVAASLRGDIGRVAAAAAENPDARRVAMRSTDGRQTADAVLLPDGTGYVVRTNLPELPPDRTYQLWAVVGENKISVGVLGSDPGPAAFHTSGDVAALAITEEQVGGVIASQRQPAVVGTPA